MWKGVTEFLENVDQKAAEFAQRREDQSPQYQAPFNNAAPVADADGSDDEDWDLEAGLQEQEGAIDEAPKLNSHAEPASFSSGPSPSLPPPPPVSREIFSSSNLKQNTNVRVAEVALPTHDAGVLKQQLATLTKRMADMTKTHETEVATREKAYASLQGDYDAVVAKNRSLAIEVDHWKVLAQQSTDATSALELRIQAAEAELGEAKARRQREASELEQWEMQCNEQLSQLEEQRRELTAVTSQARKATESANAARAELSDYRLRSKILLDEKDRQIFDLGQALESSKTASSTGKPQPHEDGGASTAQDGIRPEAFSALEASLKQCESRLKTMNEQLQQKTNELDAVEANLKSQQLLNAQLKELLDGESSAKVANAKSFASSLAEKESIIESLEKKLNQRGVGLAPITTDAELERKAKELAQLLMEKQSALEARRAEADQWRTRYEVSQQRLREAELVSNAVQRGSDWGGSSRRANPRGFSDVGSAEAQSFESSESVAKHRLMAQLSSRGGVGANVVRAAEQVDRLSLKAGAIMRRNSLLRVFVVLYVIILQLYIFVLFSFSSSIPSGNAHEGVRMAGPAPP